MAKTGGTLEYNIQFAINKQNLNNIQKSLDEIIAKAKQFEQVAPDYAGSFQEASEAAKDFKSILSGSWNDQIGKIDYSKVQQGLINLYGSTKDFKNILAQIGPEGQQVFSQFTKAIINTQIPIKKTNAALDKLAISFKNTVRYGISSSIWNNFSNSVQKAYSYVKELDKSLNDIRIVSGQSADQMERLARQANKTAQELGKSTLDYTKAALIYYQQGLSGEAVTERTEITLKMANVLGDSAKEVSNYMTAIWNNFKEGSKSLEYYADIITALGASTAASSEEIAEGLSKFSAVAKTVGLTYDYATAALATVVAQTRQSADIVGTAFKTLFARIQDLELGKTLDDGTTLGKYAQALEKVGITIKTSSGELKSMNNILDEMGNKWNNLNEAEKVALAQNVAGTRQYTQLIALMDNWDSFQTNLATAGDAEGTLAKQQEIYLDSLEAHLKRMDTAWEGLYKNIFDEDALKSLTDILTDIINLANTFITGLGGGLNSIIYIAMTLGSTFSNHISQNLIRMKDNADSAKAALRDLAVAKQLVDELDYSSSLSQINREGIENYINEYEINKKILDLKNSMTKEDQETLAMNDKIVTELREELEVLEKIKKHKKPDTEHYVGDAKTKREKEKELLKTYEDAGVTKQQWQMDDFKSRIATNQDKRKHNDIILEKIKYDVDLDRDDVKYLGKTKGFLKQRIDKNTELINKADKKGLNSKLVEKLQLENKELIKQKKYITEVTKAGKSYKDSFDVSYIIGGIQTHNETLDHNIEIYDKAIDMLESENDLSDEIIDKKISEGHKVIDNINLQKEGLVVDKEREKELQNFISGLFTIGSSISSIIGMGKTLFNPDLSNWEKITSIFSVLATQSMIIFNNWDKIKSIGPTIVTWAAKKVALMDAEKVTQVENVALKKVETAEDAKQVGFLSKQNLLNILKIVKQGIINTLKAIEALLSGKITALGIAATAALVAGAIALGKWVYNLIKSNSEEAKLKKKVEETTKAAQKAQEAYKEIKETFDSYEEARKSIDSLTEGTIEFYEAIQKSNEAAEELIKKLNLVAGIDYGIDEHGLINIKQDRLTLKMYQEQQKTFRAQADKYQAQLNLEKYNQKKITEKFINLTAVNATKTTETVFGPSRENIGTYGFTEEAARDILANPASKKSQTGAGYTGELQKLNWTKTGKDNEEEVDINEEVRHLSVLYQKSIAQQDSLNQLVANNLVLGYASQSELTEYNQLSTRLKQVIGDAILYQKQNFVKEKVNYKEEYMKNVLGYIKDEKTGIWYDSSTGAAIDYDKTKKNIKEKEAKERYNSGEYVTQSVLQEQLQKYEKFQNQLAKTNFEKTSQTYITEALMGSRKAIDLLNEEEFKYYLKSKYANINPEEAINTIKNGEQFNTNIKPDKINTSNIMQAAKSMISSVNMQKDIEQWLEASSKFESTQKRLLEETQNYWTALQSQAEALGTSKEALDFYAYAMDNANKKEHKQNQETAEAAIAQYKFNKAYNESRKIYSDNKELIDKYNKALKNHENLSYDLADAMGELSKTLKDMGLSLSSETISTHLNLIDKLLNGTEKDAEDAYAVLYKLSKLDTLKDFFGDPKQLKNGAEILAKYEEIVKGIDETKPGANLAQQYADSLAQMINDTELTVDQIKQLADQLGIEIPVTMNVPEKFEVTDQAYTQKAQAVQHTYNGEMLIPDGMGGYKKENVNYKWTEFIEDKTEHFLVPKTTNFKVNQNAQNLKGKGAFKISASNSKSGGSSNKPDKMDPIEKDIDRYHKVNTQITKVDNSLKKLQSRQEKFVGSKLIDNLNQQWELLNTQIDNYNEKLKIAHGEQKELGELLASKGVKFNEDGTINNYAEFIKARVAEVNELIEQYNAMSQEQQEKNKEKVELAKQELDKDLEMLDRYDELVSDFIPDLRQQIYDALDKQIEINVKKFNMEIEISLKLNNATREWNDWVKTVIKGVRESDILGNANATLAQYGTYYNESGNGDVQTATRHVNEVLEEIRKMERGEDNKYGDNKAQALEDLQKYYTQLMESMSQVYQLQRDLHQAVMDEIEAVQEGFDKQVENYRLLNSIMEHDKKLIALVYGEDAYDKFANYYQQQQENYNKTLEFQRMEKEFWEKEMDSERSRAELLKEQLSTLKEGSAEWINVNNEYQDAEERLEAVTEKWKSSVENFNQTLEEGLQNAVDKFQNAINDIFKTLNNKVTNGQGLDYVKTEWDLINKNVDRYLDTINSTYEIRALEKKYTEAINSNNNIKVQQRLKKVMDEQVNSLKEKDRITQYDIDRANKLYDIELARIALEDAQDNKAQMRLRRDSQGNYTYQYVADTDALDAAQAKIDELYNSLYNFDKERYNQILNDMYDSWNEYQQAMAEAALINDPAIRAEREKLIQEQYNILLTQINKEYQDARYNLEDSFYNDWVYLNTEEVSIYKDYFGENGEIPKTMKNLSQEEFDIINKEMIPNWENGLTQMAKAFSGEEGFEKTTIEAWKAIKTAENEYAIDVGKLETTSGDVFSKIGDGYDTVIQKITDPKNGLLKANQDAINKYVDEYNAVKNVYDKVMDLARAYKEQADAAKEASDAGWTKYQKELRIQEEQAKQQKPTSTTSNPDEVPTKDYVSTDNKAGGGSTNITNGGSGGTPTPSKSPQKQKDNNPPKTTNTTTTNTQKQETYTITKDYGYSSKKEIVWVVKGSSITLETPSRSGYDFEGWEIPSLGLTTYKKGRTYTPTKNETVKATWTKKPTLVQNVTGGLSKGAATGIGSIAGLATGGYTGEWNNGDNNGRLAVLHQKELVLNAKDTENMLNTVAIMRNITQSLGSNTLARVAGISAIGANSNGTGVAGLEQDVHIDAQFPNVHSAAEIEQALNNLVNAAAQRSMIKR